MELWVLPEDVCQVEGADADQIELAAHAASEFMWAETGRQFGVGTETVRPCRTRSGARNVFDLPSTWGIPTSGQYLWGVCGCSRPDACSCRSVSWVRLPRDFISEIIAVTVDGEALTTDDYVLRGRNRLYRTPYTEAWPCCQDLTLPDTEEGTWSVTYRYGPEVPKVAVIATRRLACEYVKAQVDDASCRLPANARTVNRAGLSIDLKQFYAENGTTGMFEVDAALRSLNPNGISRRATAWSPELSGKAVRERPVSS